MAAAGGVPSDAVGGGVVPAGLARRGAGAGGGAPRWVSAGRCRLWTGGGAGLVEFSGCDLLAGLGACSCWAGAVCFVQSSTKSNTILCATFHH